MSFIVFLDVDGVLNSPTSCVCAPSGMYIGIDESRVRILSAAMRWADADGVVLTTTWKNLRKDHMDYIYLENYLSNHGIDILGKTTDHIGSSREDGIIDYLDSHPEIDDFIILDDQHYGFDDHNRLWERYLDTKGSGIEHAECASNTPAISAMVFLEGIKKTN